MARLGGCNGSCNTLDDPSSRCRVANKTNVNLNVFNMITRINKSNTLMKHISCYCKHEFYGEKFNSD